LAALPKGGSGAEIGTWRGDFAASILFWSRPTQLFLVDSWRFFPQARHAMFGIADQAEMDQIHEGVRDRFSDDGRVIVLRKRSLEAAERWDGETLDWVYLDADHTYESVAADLKAWWRALRPGGILAGDDYGFPGWWADGVTQAVDEFAAARQLGLTVMGSQFLLRKPDSGEWPSKAT
jgi:SAM-dependent methyltransferase